MELIDPLLSIWQQFDPMGWLRSHQGWQLYAALALLVFVETFPFIGSIILIQPILAAVGYWAHDGALHPVWTTLAVAAGAVLADQLGYGLGWRFGQRWLDWLVHSERLSGEFVARWRGRLRRYAFWVLLAAKYNPMTRTLMPILAGMLPLRWGRFTLYSVVASLGWATFWLSIGYGLNHLWTVQQWSFTRQGLLAGAGLALLMGLGWWLRRGAVRRPRG